MRLARGLHSTPAATVVKTLQIVGTAQAKL